MNKRAGQALILWLGLNAALVAAMMAVGAITRLTDSGLSMVEWRPILGILPPLSDAEWTRVFSLYQNSPEYRHVNTGMRIEEFRGIFWWEYIHRLFGRVLGLVYALPLVFFWVKGHLPKGFTPHLLVIFCLGGGQGVLGWWMVQSGLVDRVDVSPYRLSAHLGLAFVIYLYLLWMLFSAVEGTPPFLNTQATRQRTVLYRLALSMLGLGFATVIAGAFVAGQQAGLVYNEWPLMGGRWIPEDYRLYNEFWKNAFENPVAAQLHHRLLAYGLAGLALVFLSAGWRVSADVRRARGLAVAVFASISAQMILGITTLLLHVPIASAVLHQFGATLVLSVLLFATHCFRPKASVAKH